MRDCYIYYCILSLFLVSLWGIKLPAQQYIFDAQLLTTEDGLSNLMTYSIYQDKSGFMWIGTPYGLNRYDGYSFNYYTKEKHGLQRNGNIRGIKEDADGNLWLFYISPAEWFSSVYAIDIFNPVAETTVPIEEYFQKEIPFKVTEVIYPHVIDPQNRIWIATRKGELFLYEQGKFQKIFEQKESTFQYLTVDEKGHIWLGYDKNVLCINQAGKILEQHTLEHYIYGIWAGENGTMWFAGSSALSINAEIFVWKKEKNAVNPNHFTFSDPKGVFRIKSNDRIAIYRDRHGFWYINVDNQHLLFDNQGVKLYNFNSLIDIENIRPLHLKYFESDEYVWWGTGKGMLKTSVRKNPFKHIHHTPNDLSDSRGITEDEEGNIYFLNRELYRWIPESHSLSQLIAKKYNGYALGYLDSKLYRGAYGSQVLGYQFDLRTRQDTPLTSATGADIYSFIPSKRKGRLLMGTDAGPQYIETENGRVLPFKKYKAGNPSDESLHKNIIYHFHENSTGIWAATSNGVFLLDEDKGILEHFNTSNGLPFV
ncbi:MAG: hypothetical protein KDE26_30285, partial [Bacteroidetes bacterium]|nr:hypothetical protein [Bacteroidota bacterium]